MGREQRIWTDEEDQFLKNNYGKMSLAEIGRRLNNRSKESVNNRINRLKLRTAKKRMRKPWNDEEDDFLRKNINNMTNKEIGEQLDKSPSSVATRIKVLKLKRDEPLKRWTKEEDEYLLTHYGTKSVPNIANKLGRTEKAVQSRVERLGIYGGKANTGYLSVYELADALGVDPHSVYLWIKKRKMPYRRSIVISRKFTVIDVEAFWRWANKNRDIVNWSRVPNNVLIPEPEWVEEQRRMDYHRLPWRENQNWTDEEDNRMKNLYHQHGYTQKEVGEIMGRSQRAIQRRLERLVKSQMSG